MKYELDEIAPQTIIANSWNKEEVLNYYNENRPSADESEEAEPSVTSNQDNSTSCQCCDTQTTSNVSTESIYIADDELADYMAELEAEEQKSIAKVKERELMKKRYEDHLEEEMWELNQTMKSVFCSKTCA